MTGSRATRIAGVAVVMLAVAIGAWVRIQTTFRNPSFDRTRAEGQLVSDPALLYYMTERVVDSGGLPPDDFRADPRVEHPETTDLPAMFTVGQEFYVAWTYLLFGRNMPLHAFSVIAMGIFASLAAIGVYGLALELTGRVRWAGFAALTFAITRANYRTAGFILMREDFSLPLFAAHLWLLARASRLRTVRSYVLAALALAAALSTWHAMAFVAALEAAAFFLWFLRTGRNPLSARGAWIFPAVLAAAALLVPVLRAKLFLFSLPMQILAALLMVALLEKRFALAGKSRILAGVGLWGVALILSLVAPRFLSGDAGDYAHVFELMWAKVLYLGRLPDDPDLLSFGVRLLWQGPFETGSVGHLLGRLSVLGILLLAAVAYAVPGWIRGRGDDGVMILMAFVLLATFAAVLVRRLTVLDGMVAPVAATLFLSRLRPTAGPRPRSWLPWMIGLGLIQAALFASTLPDLARRTWHPPAEKANLARFVEWARSNLDDRGAIATDFINSTAVLAHTDHPVILQPKYETLRSRRRIETFVSSFFHESPWELRRRLREEFDCRYLLVDLYVMNASRYQAGLADGERPAPGSAAAALMSTNPRIFASVPGFRLVYGNDELSPTWRLFRIE